MHVLHHPHALHRAIGIAVAAAVLAVILTLAAARALNDISPASPTNVTATPIQAPSAGSAARTSPFTRSPFTGPLLTTPVRTPWATARP